MADMRRGPMVQLMATWVHTKSELLVNEEMLRGLFQELVLKLDMTVLIPTIGVRVPTVNYTDTVSGRKPEKSDFGVTMFTVISESHIAIHTWPNFRKAWFEVASCRKFDESVVETILRKYFPGCELDPWRAEDAEQETACVGCIDEEE